MANVYIGTNLQLKDKNFSRNLKKIADETKTQTDRLKNSFMSVSTAIKGMVAAAGVGKMFTDIASSLKQTERSVGALRAITSSAEDARAKFQELNDLSREIPQDFDAITAAAITLGKSGLDTSAKNIEALAKISRGTGLSLEGLAQSITNASLGQVKGLRQLGIIAKQEGDSLTLTYQGVTETIGNNTREIQAYFNRLANSKFADTLKPEMEGITGAQKRLGEAWGDLTRAIGQGGVGDIIKDVLNTATKAMDALTQSIETGLLGDVIQNIKSTWRGVFDSLSAIFADLGQAAESVSGIMVGAFDGAGDGILAKLSHVLKLAALGFRKLYSWIQGTFGALGALGERIGSSLQQAMSGGTERVMRDADLKNRYKQLIDARLASMTEAEKSALAARGLTNAVILQKIETASAVGAKQTAMMIGITEESLRKAEKAANDNRVRMGDAQSPSLLDDMAKSFSDANEQANKIIAEIAADDEKKRKERAQKLAELGVKGVAGRLADGAADIVSALAQLTNPKKEDTGAGAGAGSGGGGSATVADTWTPYYQSFLDAQSKALSKAEQIEYQYRQKIKELDDKFAANAVASQEQYNSVRLALDKEYVGAKKALEQEAINFLEQLRGNENYSLQSEYLQKLELLQQYHEQRLISEQDFLEQEKAIRDAYYAEDAEITKRRRQEKFDKQHEPYLQQASALGQLAQAFSGLTSSMDESSGAYRALFAVQKGFAVASATMNAVVAWMNAFANGGPWPANLAAYGQAIAMTTSILAELSSIKAYDKGGSIPAGAVGLVGEIGPELIRGPASVTSRKDTAAILGGKDITINLIEDASRAGQVGKTETDSGEIIDIVVANIRNGGGVSDAISTAYGLSRRGQ